MKTVIKLRYIHYCPSCGDEFAYRKHRGWLTKTLLSFLDIRKYYCDFCKKTYIVNKGKASLQPAHDAIPRRASA